MQLLNPPNGSWLARPKRVTVQQLLGLSAPSIRPLHALCEQTGREIVHVIDTARRGVPGDTILVVDGDGIAEVVVRHDETDHRHPLGVITWRGERIDASPRRRCA